MFAKHLRAVGDEFRSKYLNSTDEADRIPFEEDWTKMKVAPPRFLARGCASGGSPCPSAGPGPGSVSAGVPRVPGVKPGGEHGRGRSAFPS